MRNELDSEEKKRSKVINFYQIFNLHFRLNIM